MTTLLRTLSKGLMAVVNNIAIIANVIGTLVVLGLVVIVNFDVVARGVFNQPFRGAVEVVQFSMVLIVFLQLPDVVRVDRLTQSDGFLQLMGRKKPRVALAMRRAISALSALFMGAIAVAVWPQFVEMWESQDFFGVPGIFTAPWWPIKLVIVISAALCTILFASKAIRPSMRGKPIRLTDSGALKVDE